MYPIEVGRDFLGEGRGPGESGEVFEKENNNYVKIIFLLKKKTNEQK